MKKNIWRTMFFTMLAVVVIFIASAAASGAFTTSLPYTIEIIAGDTGLSYYADATATQPITGFQLAIVKRGTVQTFSFWAKNTGTETLTGLVASTGAVVWGAATIAPANVGTLTAGQTKAMTFTANVSASAPLGVYSTGNITFSSP